LICLEEYGDDVDDGDDAADLEVAVVDVDVDGDDDDDDDGGDDSALIACGDIVICFLFLAKAP
jgi:hypothetical protein